MHRITQRAKVATLDVYTPHGTATGLIIDVRYRGRVLYSFGGHRADTGELLQKAITWSHNQGFTGTKSNWKA
jgi:hypothetical protein